MDKSILDAITALQPDAPIYAFEIGVGSITLVLPSKRLTYAPSLREGAGGGKTKPPPAEHDDFTAIPYVGKEITLALQNAGFRTFDDLVKTPDTTLLEIPHINTYTLGKIRKYLKEHYL